jgi:hypothetical protein
MVAMATMQEFSQNKSKEDIKDDVINNLHIKRWKINIKLKDMIHHTEYNTAGKVKL